MRRPAPPRRRATTPGRQGRGGASPHSSAAAAADLITSFGYFGRRYLNFTGLCATWLLRRTVTLTFRRRSWRWLFARRLLPNFDSFSLSLTLPPLVILRLPLRRPLPRPVSLPNCETCTVRVTALFFTRARRILMPQPVTLIGVAWSIRAPLCPM